MENPVEISAGTALVSTDELARAADYARDAKSESTRRAYRSDWRHFEQWCAARSVDAMPAEVGTVAAYLAHLADTGLKASTITRRVAAISYAHRLTSAAPPTSAEPVKAVLKGIRRRIGVAVERKAPATARAIKTMVSHCKDNAKAPTDRGCDRDLDVLGCGPTSASRRSSRVKLLSWCCKSATKRKIHALRRAQPLACERLQVNTLQVVGENRVALLRHASASPFRGAGGPT
jgi:integrase family protein with SAM-like domain